MAINPKGISYCPKVKASFDSFFVSTVDKMTLVERVTTPVRLNQSQADMIRQNQNLYKPHFTIVKGDFFHCTKEQT